MLGLLTTGRTLDRAGELLFVGGPDTPAISYSFRRSPTGPLVANELLEGPRLVTLPRLLDLIEARLDRTSVNVAGGQQLQIADVPESALREAVVNAIMHRDYRAHRPVTVEHAPGRLVVTSPGAFVSGVTVATVLTTSSRVRNPSLATAIRSLGLAETAGTGVDKMYAAMARLGHQPPRFSDDADNVQVVLAGGAPNIYVAKFTASLPSEVREDADTMVVLLTLLSARIVTASALAPLVQRPPPEAQAVLAGLSTAPFELVEPTRETARFRQPSYRLRSDVVASLGPAVTYARRTTDDMDRKIVGMVRETGTINGRMVRLLFDLDPPVASRVLGDLVRRGVLIKTSAAARGPGVTYGPGPDFPDGPQGKRV